MTGELLYLPPGSQECGTEKFPRSSPADPQHFWPEFQIASNWSFTSGGLQTGRTRASVSSMRALCGATAATMSKPPRPKGNYVIGPDGSPLTIADLPSPGTKRWVPRRKAEVVAAVLGGLLSLQEACGRYSLTVDEFHSWQESIDQFGLRGLRTTRTQRYRPGHRRRAWW